MTRLCELQLELLSNISTKENSSTVGISKGITIYQNAYLVRLYNALVDNFPVLFNYLSDHEFSELANKYIYHNPSRNFSLQQYGDKLVDFIYQHEYPEYYSELCIFDLSVKTIAAERILPNTLLLNDFQLIAETYGDNFKLELSTAVKLIQFKYNVLDVIDRDYDSKVELKSEKVIFFQKDLTPHYRKLSIKEYAILSKLIKPYSFVDFWSMLEEYYHYDLSMMIFKTWLSDGIFCYKII